MAKRLTVRQQKFAELVANGSTQWEAMRDAGYSMPKTKHKAMSRASELARKPWVADEIKRLSPARPLAKHSHIADPKELMAMYTQIMRDPTSTAKEKMEAADKLSKLRGEHGKIVDEERSKEWMHLMPGTYEHDCLINLALQAVQSRKAREQKLHIVEQD